MREVVVLGVGLHQFGRWPQYRHAELARKAIFDALNEANAEFRQIQALWVGCVVRPQAMSWSILNEVGMTGIPILNVESACTSASSAFREAYFAVGAGIYDVAMAVGVEKMQRGLQGAFIPDTLGGALGLGMMPATYAQAAVRHMRVHGSTIEQFAQVSVKNHRNGALNPNAQYHKEMTLEEVLGSRMVAEPLTLYQCSPTTDGASCAILCAKEKAEQFTNRYIAIAGWGAGSQGYSGGEEGDLAEGLVERASRQAYERAGIGPKDVDVCQVHDAFTPGELLTIESLGFCPVGMGGVWTAEGKTEINGEIPVNTDGGLIARGHPMGATGIAQIAEIVWQLRGDAGPRQVKDAKVGLTHNVAIGGCNIHIFKR